MTVQAAVFDIGNVLLTWQPERYFDRLLGAEGRARLFAETGIEAMNAEADRHGDLTGAVRALARQHPDHAQAIHHWIDHWLEIAQPVIHPSVHLLKALQAKGVPVFALTNFAADSWDIACAAHPFLTSFDVAVVSGRINQIKPDPGIYAALEAQTGLSGGALLFADDKPENIAAAAARGWQTHLFTDPAGWAGALVAHGLLTSAEAQVA